jgi:hypothetical protein
MSPLKKIWKSSSSKKKILSAEELEVETLLVGMFRDLPQEQRQIVLDILTEFYCIEKKKVC